MKKHFLLLLLVSFLLVATGVSAETPGEEAKILFVNLDFTKNYFGTSYSAEIKDTAVVPGSFIEIAPSGGDISDAEIRCSFLDANYQVIKSVIVEHPLVKVFENPDEEEGYSKVILDKGGLALRIDAAENPMYLRIEGKNSAGIESETGFFVINTGATAESLSTESAYAAQEESIPDYEVVKVFDSGPDENRVNLVFLADGFTESEIGSFVQAVNELVDEYIFHMEPFYTYQKSFNVYMIKSVSNVSGIAQHPNSLIDNNFQSTRLDRQSRIFYCNDEDKVFATVRKHVPTYSDIMVLLNTSIYGGSGGRIAVASMHGSGGSLVTHEIAHTLADLADEYWPGYHKAREAANMTQDNNPETIKWKDFLGVDGVGIYGYSMDPTVKDWFHPHEHCKMESLSRDFCPVCEDAFVKKIVEFTGGIHPTAPPTPEVDYDSLLYPKWLPRKNYNGGDKVYWKGNYWEAKYWTEGNEPGGYSDTAGVWTDLGPAGDSTPTPTYTPTQTPTTGPTATPTPTLDVTPTPTATDGPVVTPTPTATQDTSGCTYSAWDSSSAYTQFDKVHHDGRNWEAKWYANIGEEPGKTGTWGVWKDLGACTGDGQTPTPTATTGQETPTATPTTENTVTPTPTSGSGSVSEWAVDTHYNKDDVVTYDGTTYRCLQAHTAIASWAPPNVPTLWTVH